MEKIKAGVIGVGFIGPSHIEALRRLGFVDVLAIADANEELTKKKAEILNITKAYGDYRALLNDKEIDVVHICSPNHLHYNMIKDSLAAGKHVICEKPFAMDSMEGLELLELSKKTDLVTALHFNIRFYPLVQQAREMIRKQEIGEILAINGSYQQDWLFYETDYNWRLEPEYSGASRAVADIGSHWLDLMEYITGNRVLSACSDFATFYPFRKKPLMPLETFSGKMMNPYDYKDIKVTTEDYASVLLRFDNNAHGSLTVNQVAAGRKNRIYFEIYGTEGSIAWDGENPNEIWFGKREGSNSLMIKDPSLMSEQVRSYASYPGGHTEGFPDTSKQLFFNVYSQIKDRQLEYDYPSFEDGYRELLLCEAIVKSAKERKWVEI
jgi:predicted dehydrogenase